MAIHSKPMRDKLGQTKPQGSKSVKKGSKK